MFASPRSGVLPLTGQRRAQLSGTRRRPRARCQARRVF